MPIIYVFLLSRPCTPSHTPSSSPLQHISTLEHGYGLQVTNDKLGRTLVSLDSASRDLGVGPHNLAVGNEVRARQVAAGVVAPVDLEVGASVDMGEGEGHAVVVAGCRGEVGDHLVGEGGRAADDGLGGADGHVEVEAEDLGQYTAGSVWGCPGVYWRDENSLALGGVRHAAGVEAGDVELGRGLPGVQGSGRGGGEESKSCEDERLHVG